MEYNSLKITVEFFIYSHSVILHCDNAVILIIQDPDSGSETPVPFRTFSAFEPRFSEKESFSKKARPCASCNRLHQFNDRI